MDLNEAIEKAAADAQVRRLADPELNRKQIFTLCDVVQGFATGIIRSTPGTKDGGLSLPINFESVVNWVAAFAKQRYGPDRIAQGDVFLFEASINDIIGTLHTAAEEHPSFRRWNTDDSAVHPFIDLDAIFQNVVIALRESSEKNQKI